MPTSPSTDSPPLPTPTASVHEDLFSKATSDIISPQMDEERGAQDSLEQSTICIEQQQQEGVQTPSPVRPPEEEEKEENEEETEKQVVAKGEVTSPMVPTIPQTEEEQEEGEIPADDDATAQQRPEDSMNVDQAQQVSPPATTVLPDLLSNVQNQAENRSVPIPEFGPKTRVLAFTRGAAKKFAVESFEFFLSEDDVHQLRRWNNRLKTAE